MDNIVKETITVYEKNGKIRETLENEGDAAIRDLAHLLYCKIRKFNYTVKDNGYGRITITSHDEFGKVTYSFKNCDKID